jgi:hypothetical protein
VGGGRQQGGGGALSHVRRDLGEEESPGAERMMCRWCHAARRRHSGREDVVGHRGGVEQGVPRAMASENNTKQEEIGTPQG